MRGSVVVSAVVAVIVGFGGTLALIVAAAQSVGASPAETSSWVAALCLSMAATSSVLSIRHRLPIVTAWSTPGAALIAASSGIDLASAVGAFLLAGALVLVTALFRPIAAWIERIPTSVAAAMLAGALIRFVIAVFDSAQAEPLLVLPLVLLFLVMRVVSPFGAVLIVLVAGVALATTLGLTAPMPATLAFSWLVFTAPRFDPAVLLGLGLPLYLVTMASQNLPGFAVLRAAGYPVPSRSILAVTGLASVATAPFGAHASNLAAITASICTGPDAHPDKEKRWLAGPVYGASYLVLAVFGASLVALFQALPPALIVTVAGTALIGPLAGALGSALADEKDRIAATLTLAVTASGVSFLGIGSAFWGLAAGLATLAISALIARGHAGS
ncbi:MAG: benzoate/H(+) symporter BenE family transporter [Alphaproteobacteria bacterium]|nr:benzoate/H(+) symporter BenE family transporter [Alphaproteobacteria bacterium]